MTPLDPTLLANYERVANDLADWIDNTPVPATAISAVYGAHVLLCELIRERAHDGPGHAQYGVNPTLLARVREVALAYKAARAAYVNYEPVDEEDERLMRASELARHIFQQALSPDVALALVDEIKRLEAETSPGYDGNCACLWEVLPKGAGATGPQIQECAGHRDVRLRAEQAESTLAAEREAHRQTREALAGLRNEVMGALGYAEADLILALGYTNLQCLKRRLEEADAILDRSPR